MKPNKPNQFKLINFEKLKNTKAWKLTSEYVRKKYKNICYTCNKVIPYKKLSAGHFREKRGNAGVYFDLDNLRPQCFFCNRRRHGQKDIYAKKLLEEIGEKRFNDLFKKSVGGKVWNEEELSEIAEERQKLIESIQEL